VDGKYFLSMLKGFEITVIASAITGIVSLIVGAVVGSSGVFGPGLARCSRVYVNLFRNMPPLIYLFFIFAALPTIGLVWSPIVSGIVGLSLYSSAYYAECIRGGIGGVESGQLDAARMLGLSNFVSVSRIVLPQGFRLAIPSLMNSTIALIKNTSLFAAITVPELIYHATKVQAVNFKTYVVFGFAAALYVALILPLSYGSRVLERRLGRSIRGDVGA
jgi:His/Glu/Gln/Arg/opine family amino acid ABC transporter permease subunit